MHPSDVRAIDPDLAEAYDAVDWAATPLGAIESWTPALRHAFDACLHTQFESTLLWGPELVMVYNPAYVAIIGEKHPAALGSPAEEAFPEAWDQVGPLLTGVLDTGVSVLLEDVLIPLRRHGFLEDVYFSFCYSPLHDDDGRVVGVLDISTETTTRVLAVRRLSRFAELRGVLADVDTAERVAAALGDVFADDPDLPALALRIPGAPVVDDLPSAPRDESLVPGRVLVEQHPGGPVAWLCLPASHVGRRAARRREAGTPRTPLLVARLNPRLPVDAAYEEHVALIGTTLAQTWDRLAVLDLERQVAASEREVSLSLQRSLLGRPATVPGVEVAVRYDPASSHAQIGGDWYDAFIADDGELVLSVGDVEGHDVASISVMGQIRTLLRGLGFRSADDPGTVMSLLDDVLGGLDLATLASGLLARLTPADPGGSRCLTWSSAGHPPPLLISPDGSTRLLDVEPQPLLGLVGLPGAATHRASHREVLQAGSSLVLYTDGVVERRRRHLDDGFAWLLDVCRDQQHLSAEELADRLVADLPGRLDDDVALLVVHLPDRDARA